MLYTNADTFVNKRHELKIVIDNLKNKPQVIAITEVNSKKGDSLSIAELKLEGYNLYTNNLEKVSRGVLIYVEQSLKSQQIFSDNEFEEYVLVKINGLEEQIVVGNVYRSPNSSSENDNNMFTFIEECCESNKGKLVIMGDFNYPDIDWVKLSANQIKSNKFIDVLQENFLIQNVLQYTRARGSDNPHVLDLVLSNDSFIEEIEHMAPLGKSDHSVLCIKCEWQRDNSKQGFGHNFNKGDYCGLRDYLNSKDWTNILNVYKEDVEGMWNVFKDIILTGKELFVPKINNFASFKKVKWKMPIDKDLRNYIKEKNKLWKKYIVNKDSKILEQYKKMRNEVRNRTRTLYKQEQYKVAQECKSNPKKFWNYVNSKTRHRSSIGDLVIQNVQGQDVKVTDDNEKASVLCNYFSSVFNMKKEIHEVLIREKGIPNSDHVEVDVDDIVKRLNNLNVYKSPGPDMIHPRILKEARHEIAYPLKIIFDLSLKSKSLPTDWKSGNITPIYKKGKKYNANNYRPVSLTCIVSKILESIVRDSIIKHFQEHDLFSSKQYGFMKGRSTVTQLLDLLDKWTADLESGGQIDVIYTDLEKAFDKVPHEQLLRKLKSYSINSVVLEWVKSFLLNRRQRVRVSNSFSEWTKVLSGVPQGSVLGPLLFIIYINDLEESCSSESDLALFADDTKLHKYVRSESDSVLLQEDLNNIYKWVNDWLLSLNIDKCKVVSFGRKVINKYKYKIDDHILDNVDEIKDLGVIFDSKLKFAVHISDKINKAFSVLGVINRNFKYMTMDTFIMLYKSMVRSHLEYANLVWYPYRKGDIKRIEKVQRRATKLIPSLKRLSYEDRLKKLNLPTLAFRRLRGDMIEVYKIVTGKYGNNKTLKLKTNKEINTRGNNYKLYQEQSRYDIRRYFFTNRVIAAWNILPDHVVMVDSTNLFKSRLDKYWSNQDMFFNYEAELTGIGSRSHSNT